MSIKSSAALRIGAVAVLLALPLGAAGLAVYLQQRAEPSFAPERDAVFVTADIGVIDGITPVSVLATMSSERFLRSSGAVGIVTRMYVADGDELSSGALILQVDGMNRIAVSSPAPFWRDLSSGMKGEDIAWLQQFLVDQGLLVRTASTVDGTFGSDTSRAVRELSLELGASTASSTAGLDWFVWLPSDPFVVGTVGVEVGDPAPARGETLATAARVVLDFKILDADAAPVSVNDQNARELIVDGVTFAVVIGPSGDVTAVDPARLPPGLLSTELTAKAELRLVSPISVMRIPAVAVVNGPSGNCVVTIEQGEPTSHAVEIVGSSGNTVEVAADLEPTLEIVLNPRAVFPEFECA